MSASSKWLSDVRELAAAHGCEVSATSGGHFKITHPAGGFTFASKTPGDRRALQNLRSNIRAAAGAR